MLRYIILVVLTTSTAMTVQCDVLILCKVHVEVVTKSVLLF